MSILLERAVVKEIIPGGKAVVTIARDVECGANCPSCHGCGSAVSPAAEATVVNTAGAAPGDRVVLESSAGQMLVLPLMIFLGAILIPILLFYLGKQMNGNWAVCWGMALLGAGISALALWLYHGRVSAVPPISRVVRVEGKNGGI
ncbi:MAG: SoxR reducing system RseC family protein [Peptococcaceae bacterium]|nr:SoxR reducing system RseC family protein [Peptococcaceae bacterium]